MNDSVCLQTILRTGTVFEPHSVVHVVLCSCQSENATNVAVGQFGVGFENERHGPRHDGGGRAGARKNVRALRGGVAVGTRKIRRVNQVVSVTARSYKFSVSRLPYLVNIHWGHVVRTSDKNTGTGFTVRSVSASAASRADADHVWMTRVAVFGGLVLFLSAIATGPHEDISFSA